MATEIDIIKEVRSAKPDKLDKNQAIIDAARELFTTVGYQATTMAEVARKAGVGVGTLYLYFKHKQELLYAVKNDWEAEFLGFMSHPALQAIPHHLRARPMMDALFNMANDNCNMVQLMKLPAQMVGEMNDYPASRQILQALEAFLAEGIEAGAFRPVDPKAGAVIGYNMVNGALEQCFNVEDGQNQAQYREALVDALEHWLVRPEILGGGM